MDPWAAGALGDALGGGVAHVDEELAPLDALQMREARERFDRPVSDLLGSIPP
jgi:hypothetical protein